MAKNGARRRLGTCGALLVSCLALPAGAQDAPAREPDAVEEARGLYARGVELVQKAQWAEALTAFEKSSALRPHATTTFNIAACERALGRYTRARAKLDKALAEGAADGQMAPSLVADAKALLAEIDKLLARVTVTVDPAEASIAVDGRPLDVVARGARPTAVVGTAPAGAAAPLPAATFDLVLDPGAHVFVLTRKGYADVVVNKTFAPGDGAALRLELKLLPATLAVTSTKPGAIVRVNDVDVGPAPVDVLRPAGTYRVVVAKPGFLPYQTQVVVRPGEQVKLRATLLEDRPSIAERWWFWTAVGTAVAGGVVLTWALTRPEPTPPPYDGGSAGWVAELGRR